MRKEIVGVYWGRFNPVHKGHMAQLIACSKKVDKLIVAIGEAEYKNTLRNPFSGAERVAMMKAYIREMRLDPRKIRVVAVKEGKSFDQATTNLFRTCGRIDVVFMARRYPRTRFLARNIKVMLHPLKHRVLGLSATKIREAIAGGKRWESLTGKSVVALIKKLNGVNRIRSAYSPRHSFA